VQLTEQAARAAADGDCSRSAELDSRVREIDPVVHDTIFVRDAGISTCRALAQLEANKTIEAARETCLARRHTIATQAMAVSDAAGRARVYRTMPECGPASPPSDAIDPTIARRVEARRRMPELVAAAAQSARAGDCTRVGELDADARLLDVRIHDEVFAVDPAIAGCLAASAAQARLAADERTKALAGQVAAHLAAAREHASRHELDDAIREYDAARALSDDPDILFDEGATYEAAGDAARAVALYRAYLDARTDGAKADQARSRLHELEPVTRPVLQPAR
jgi:hypothetical protein